MATQYPGALVTSVALPSRAGTDATATVHAADHTQLAGEVVAIEAELGILPKGGYATVVDRLNSQPVVSLNNQIIMGLSRANGTKTATQLAETIPFELALISCNAKATPAGTAAVNQRLTLAACWLDKGVVVTAMRTYNTVAYTSATHYKLGLFTYDGTTYTCVAVTGDAAVTSGFRGASTAVYTVPSSGIYYIGHLFNGTVGTGTSLQFVDGANLLVTGGDFWANTPLYSSTAWPRVSAFPSQTDIVLGDTHVQSGGTLVQNIPWVGVIGTIL